MNKDFIEFNATDNAILNGYIMRGNTNSKDILIEVHGMTSNCFKKRERIIGEAVNSIGIDALSINTRGSEIAKYIKYTNGDKKIAGTAFEDINESYYDILGAIKYVIKSGYSNIYLQGHSLGATKIVYAYLKMKKLNNDEIKKIKGIILLSLVDLPDIFKMYSEKKYVDYAIEKEKKGEILDFMPKDSFFHPISVKTYLQYAKYNSDFDFAKYNKKNYDFSELNKISVPLFMRWGNNKELIRKDCKEQVKMMQKLIKNKQKDIDYIDGADHTYSDCELMLAKQIVTFLKQFV